MRLQAAKPDRKPDRVERERERELSIILPISKTQVPGLTNPIVKGVASM